MASGATIKCKAAVCWEPSRDLDVRDVFVEPPKEGEVGLSV
jgi:Zn-dependent alcohol dehydrogenase